MPKNLNVQTSLEERFETLTKPFEKFISNQIAGAFLLLFATIAALVFANSNLHGIYIAIEEIETGVFFGNFELRKSLHHWVNDGLMVLFFFLLGLEIKREFLVGELRSFNQSSTVIMAAAGGMVFPALFYLALNTEGVGLNGWGIPMATDAAFAIGALALLGSRVPAGLKVFLVALAIVDDIGAIIVIALFYTANLNIEMLWIAAMLVTLLIAFNRLGIRSALPYFLISLCLWYTVLQSGIHATIAGVLAALAIPARPRRHPYETANKLKKAAKDLKEIDEDNATDEILADGNKDMVLENVEQHAREARTPLRSWENYLERPVSLLVIPIFAFLNAGIALSMDTFTSMQTSNIAWGIILGLVIGKPLGIVFMTWLNVKLGWGELPENVNFPHLIGLGLLAGMGFTMSIFIATLSFADKELLTLTKMSIMVATLVAGIAGILLLWFLSKKSA